MSWMQPVLTSSFSNCSNAFLMAETMTSELQFLEQNFIVNASKSSSKNSLGEKHSVKAKKAFGLLFNIGKKTSNCIFSSRSSSSYYEDSKPFTRSQHFVRLVGSVIEANNSIRFGQKICNDFVLDYLRSLNNDCCVVTWCKVNIILAKLHIQLNLDITHPR